MPVLRPDFIIEANTMNQDQTAPKQSDLPEQSDLGQYCLQYWNMLLIDFSLTVKVTTLIFISGRGLAISSAKQGKSGSIYNMVKN